MAEPKDKFHYGGQAIIEGVMMRGPKDFGIAVRKADGEIVTTKEDVDSILGKFKWLNKPFLRGTLAMIDSMALGMKALMYSANIAMEDVKEEAHEPVIVASEPVIEPQAVPAEPEKKPSSINDMAISAMMVLGLVLGLAVFFLIPVIATKGLRVSMHLQEHSWQLSIIEGLVRITMFVGYILLISRMKDIQRVFQYHGAEHKTINAYEAGVELTVENVQKYSKVHVRCGTSFLLVVLVTSIVVMIFIGDHLPMGSLNKGSVFSLSTFVRWLYKLALLPFIAGIAYEVIRFAGRYKDSLATKLMTFPGLLMQGITTREPEPGMIEVAIKSLECVLEKESERREAEAFESA